VSARSADGAPDVDVVVVGAGSAGCVLAARLAEAPGMRVMLIEAGSAAPVTASNSFFDDLTAPGALWPDVVVRRVAGQPPTPYPRGRGLGGCSMVNAMVALPGGPYADQPAALGHLIPIEATAPDELGAVDRALLAAAPDAVRAPLNRRDGRRVSAFDAYLGEFATDASTAGEIEIRTDSEVARVLFDGARAVGVLLDSGQEILARNVVVSAGAIHSAVLLMRSGVRVAGLGEAIADHPSAGITLALEPEATADPSSVVCGSLLQRQGSQVLALNHLGHRAAGHGLLLAAAMRPRSRGRITLESPESEPHIDLAMLSDPADLDAMIAAVRSALELLSHRAFTAITRAAYIDAHATTTEALRGPDNEYCSEAIGRWVSNNVGDYVHVTGGCAMGVVVDDLCRVVGHESLFVCDASVFATIPDVNTHLPTVMLAETIAARWAESGTFGDASGSARPR